MPVANVRSRWNKSGWEGSLDFYGAVSGNSILTLSPGGAVFPNPYGGADYFVDGNVSATGDGLSWGTAFLTLAEAITASNTSIALTANRWFARRNRIFVCGDQEIEEDLTILPEKCDVIGVGYDINPYPMIIGNHAIAATRPTAGSANGCRFINCGFLDKVGATDTFVAPAGCNGLAFLGCHFIPLVTGSTGTAIELTNCAAVRIENCLIDVRGGLATGIFGLAIDIKGTTSIHDLRILNNQITATVGITIAAGGTIGSLVQGNTIRATGYCLDDASDTVQVVNNRFMSDASDDLTGTGGSALAVHCGPHVAVGNYLVSSNHHNTLYPAAT